jgi:hypothetical protein
MEKLSLGLIMYHVMKTGGGVEVKFHTFITSVLDGSG